MALAAGNSITLSADGLGSWIRLGPGASRISVKCATWNGTNVGLRFSDDGLDASETTVKDDIGGSEVVATENEVFVFSVPGYVTGDVSSYGGTAVTFSVEQVRPVPGT